MTSPPRDNKCLGESYRSTLAPVEPFQETDDHSDALALTIVFTTVASTLQALRKGAQLANRLGAKIRILVPSTVPFPLDINRPSCSPIYRLRHFRTVCEEQAIETRIDILLCRDPVRCIQDALRIHSLVLIGERRSWWPLSRERRLATLLRRDGHEVIVLGPD